MATCRPLCSITEWSCSGSWLSGACHIVWEKWTHFMYSQCGLKKKVKQDKTHILLTAWNCSKFYFRVTKPNDKAISSKCSVNNIKCNSQMLVVWIISSSSLMASCSHERDDYEMQTLWLGNTLQSNERFSAQHREAYQLCYYLPNIYDISCNFRQDFKTYKSIFMDSIAEILLNTFLLH